MFLFVDAVDFDRHVKKAVECAVACGMEINQTCSHYSITFLPKNLTDSLLTTALFTNNKSTNLYTTKKNKLVNTANPVTMNANNEMQTFLNVHAGVSVGTMAGIDIGADDRWEYLLVGEYFYKFSKKTSM
jgi:hypothetical protein